MSSLCGDTPSAPPATDWNAAAKAQGQANVDTAITTAHLNNPNVITPYGSQTVTWGSSGGGTSPAPVFDQAGYDAATAAYNRGTLIGTGDYGDTYAPSTGPAPTREQFTTGGATGGVDGAGGYQQPTITQSLAPAQQALLDKQNAISGQMADMATSGLTRVNDAVNRPIDLSGAPALQTSAGVNPTYTSSVQAGPVATGYAGGGDIARSIASAGNIGNSIASAGNIGNSIASAGNIGNSIASAGNIGNSIADAGRVATSFDAGGSQQQQLANAGNIQGQLNTSGVRDIPTADTNARQYSEDMAYRAATSRLDPQWQQAMNMQETKLRNQGLVPGGQAYNDAMRVFNEGRNDAYLQAQANAVMQGLTNQQAQFGMGLAAHQTGMSDAMNAGNFANASQQQQFGQNLAAGQFANAAQQAQYAQNQGQAQFANQAQQQQFGQNAAQVAQQNAAQQQQFQQNTAQVAQQNAAQQQQFQQNAAQAALQNAAQQQATEQARQAAAFSNDATQQQFAMGQANAALNNQVGQQTFQQGLANANLGNQARQQAVQEEAYLRSLPINELNALRSGSQVTNPQFQAYSGSQIAPAPVFQAAQNQNAYNQNIYNQQVASDNAMMSGLASLGGAAMGAPTGTFSWMSDRRLKSDIVLIGQHPLGIGVYEYTIFGHRTQGVMADEVLTVRPDAVRVGGGGYLQVDYGRLGNA